MVGAKVFLSYPPSDKSLFQLWLSPGRALPNSEQASLHFDLSYSLPLSTKQGLLLHIPWALHSCYTLGPTSADNQQAGWIPCRVFPPRSLNSRPFECHYRFEGSLQLLCLTLISIGITTSTSYVMEKGVSPVDLLGVVR